MRNFWMGLLSVLAGVGGCVALLVVVVLFSDTEEGMTRGAVVFLVGILAMAKGASVLYGLIKR